MNKTENNSRKQDIPVPRRVFEKSCHKHTSINEFLSNRTNEANYEQEIGELLSPCHFYRFIQRNLIRGRGDEIRQEEVGHIRNDVAQ